MQISELREWLEELEAEITEEADPEVIIAHPPNWPMAAAVGKVTLSGK